MGLLDLHRIHARFQGRSCLFPNSFAAMLKSLTRCLLLIPAVADVKIPTTEIADGVHMPVMSIGGFSTGIRGTLVCWGGGHEAEQSFLFPERALLPGFYVKLQGNKGHLSQQSPAKYQPYPNSTLKRRMTKVQPAGLPR